MYTNSDILCGIAKGDNSIIEYIYKIVRTIVSRMVVATGGNNEDISDIIQEAMLITYNRSISENFQLRCAFTTYFYAICRNLWINEKRKRKQRALTNFNSNYYLNDREPDFVKLRLELFDKHLNQLDEENKKLLDLLFENKSFKTISYEMGYNSEMQARKKKFLCKELLISQIKDDPDYYTLYD